MRARRGTLLLEAMIALAIVAIAGASYLALASQSAEAVARAAAAEERTRDASRFLSAVSLWGSEDLDRRLGDRRQGPWVLRIHRPSPGFYTVALLDSTAIDVVLGTALLRRGERR